MIILINYHCVRQLQGHILMVRFTKHLVEKANHAYYTVLYQGQATFVDHDTVVYCYADHANGMHMICPHLDLICI